MAHREIAFRVVAVVLGVALPLVVVEGLAALALDRDKARHKPRMPDAVRAVVNRDDRHIPTRPDPYLSFRVEPDIRRERVQTNAWGLREGAIAPRPGPDALRILLLGGSVAWGYSSNDNDDTIASYLEETLSRRPDVAAAFGGRRVEVLNGGAPAYVSWQEALAYALYLHELEPDWVFALDATNDVASAIGNGVAGVPMRFRLTESAYLAVEPSPLQALGRWLLAAARELNVVEAVARLRPRPVAAYGAPPVAEIARELARAAAFLADAAAREGARAVTVLQPMAILPDTKPLTEFERQIVAEFEHRMPGRNGYYARSYDAMRGALAALARERDGYGWIDAADAFAATPEPTYTDHCHLTPLGRRRLAERIADAWMAGLARDGTGAVGRAGPAEPAS